MKHIHKPFLLLIVLMCMAVTTMSPLLTMAQPSTVHTNKNLIVVNPSENHYINYFYMDDGEVCYRTNGMDFIVNTDVVYNSYNGLWYYCRNGQWKLCNGLCYYPPERCWAHFSRGKYGCNIIPVVWQS